MLEAAEDRKLDDWGTLDRLLQARHSCRGFLPDPLPRPLIEQILTSAQRTASWCNSQPWQLVVTSGEATDRFRDALVDYVARHAPQPDIPFPEYVGRYLERRRACGFALYDAVGIERGDRIKSAEQLLENFHGAIVTTASSLGVYGAIDCGAYISTFLFAAQSLGVATIAQAAIATRSAFVRSYFDLPDDRKVIAAISF